MFHRIDTLPRAAKKGLNMAFDMAVIALALTLAMALRMGDVWPGEALMRAWPLYPAMLALGIATAAALGISGIRLSALDLGSMALIGRFALILALAGTALNWGIGATLGLGAPRSVPLIFGPVAFCLAALGRLVVLGVMTRAAALGTRATPVAIYGAGAGGIQLVSALAKSPEIRVRAIVDDNPALHGVIIGGQRVEPPGVLDALVRSGHIAQILLAMPSVPPTRLRQIAASLETLPCEVRSLPSHADMVLRGAEDGAGAGMLSSLRPVSPDDLLGRGAVDLDVPDIAKAYAGRAIMITGAGGSIGAELCRQVLHARPRRLVLYEWNEFALYTIEREIRPVAEAAGVAVSAVLGSVGDAGLLDATLGDHGVETILHTAAYKHVPLVEANVLAGVRNNVFGTRTLARAAEAAGVERFILVSSDKAVRPAGVMGATKRLAEMVIQDLQTRSPRTRFAMVRFGNVLDSSGSVIPLFRAQIAAGGPVTLTHADMTRYFMTLPEATRLVLLAGAFAEGGDVFVLDMGDPVKIGDLARRMIELSGLSVRDAVNPDGDIRVRLTGLRPGEKLYEELMIGAGTLATPHPKILRAAEACPSEIEIAGALRELGQALEACDRDAVRGHLEHWVEGYHATHGDRRLGAGD